MADAWQDWLRRAKQYGQDIYRNVKTGLTETEGLGPELAAKQQMMDQARQALQPSPMPVDPQLAPYAPPQRTLARPMSGRPPLVRLDSGPGF